MRFQRDAGGLGECLQALGLEMRRNNRSLEDEVRPLPGSKDGQRLLAEWKGTHFRPDGWIELSEDMIEALRGWYIPEQCSYRASNGQIYPTRFSTGLCTKASNHKPVTTRLVRRHLWMSPGGFSMSRRDSDSEKVPAALYDRLTDTPTYAARMYKVQTTGQ